MTRSAARRGQGFFLPPTAQRQAKKVLGVPFFKRARFWHKKSKGYHFPLPHTKINSLVNQVFSSLHRHRALPQKCQMPESTSSLSLAALTGGRICSQNSRFAIFGKRSAAKCRKTPYFANVFIITIPIVVIKTVEIPPAVPFLLSRTQVDNLKKPPSTWRLLSYMSLYPL